MNIETTIGIWIPMDIGNMVSIDINTGTGIHLTNSIYQKTKLDLQEV